MRSERELFNRIYYRMKPIFSRRLQIAVRRLVAARILQTHREVWPINPAAGSLPRGWTGWPEGKKFAVVVTHDVDTIKGEEHCLSLMRVDRDLGFRSAFYFVPGCVRKSRETIPELKRNGFEVGVHGLLHNGKLFRDKTEFLQLAPIINGFLSKWGAVGFRGDSMHRRLQWMHELNILYDASTFDVDPFEPFPDGSATLFPYCVENTTSGKRYVELPYTLPQDFTLYVILRQKDNGMWESKLDCIAAKGGMALLLTHPDYMNFHSRKPAIDEYSIDLYTGFLDRIKQKYAGLFWQPLPAEMAKFWTSRCPDSNNRQCGPVGGYPRQTEEGG